MQPLGRDGLTAMLEQSIGVFAAEQFVQSVRHGEFL
jgi:hypothetical protein